MTRKASLVRKTLETNVDIDVNLDGNFNSNINSGSGFLDHMLYQFSKYSLIDINLKATSDINSIDAHHLVEDVALTLGSAILKALGNKIGIYRYGFFILPMDEALTRAVIDISGRPYPIFDVKFKGNRLGDIDTQLFREWFFAFANSLQCNLHIKNFYGENDHHIAESCFKSLGKAMRMAIEFDSKQRDSVISTKGKL